MYQINEFNYSEVDKPTADFLKNKEMTMRNIMTKAYTELGKELKDAQERLSNQRNGIFEEWYMSLGFKKSQVNRIINRYNFIVSNWDNKEVVESLPISLSYEISKPSADAEVRTKVLNGEIKTLKELKQHESVRSNDELNKITAEIKIYQNQINFYKDWFVRMMELVKKYPQHKEMFIEDLGLIDFSFAHELRMPTNEEFFEYIIYKVESDFHSDIERLKL